VRTPIVTRLQFVYEIQFIRLQLKHGYSANFSVHVNKLLTVSRDAVTRVCFPYPSNDATTRLDITSRIRETWFESLLDHRLR